MRAALSGHRAGKSRPGAHVDLTDRATCVWRDRLDGHLQTRWPGVKRGIRQASESGLTLPAWAGPTPMTSW